MSAIFQVFTPAKATGELRRCAQVVAADAKKGAAAAEAATLVEVGPRACLMPIRIFAGSFGGPVLYENPAYVSPNQARACSSRAQQARPKSAPLREGALCAVFP